jgi:hypothetical protein
MGVVASILGISCNLSVHLRHSNFAIRYCLDKYRSRLPQLILVKAARSGHLVIAGFFFEMGLLANLLAIAFVGMLFSRWHTVQYNNTASALGAVLHAIRDEVHIR